MKHHTEIISKTTTTPIIPQRETIPPSQEHKQSEIQSSQEEKKEEQPQLSRAEIHYQRFPFYMQSRLDEQPTKEEDYSYIARYKAAESASDKELILIDSIEKNNVSILNALREGSLKVNGSEYSKIITSAENKINAVFEPDKLDYRIELSPVLYLGACERTAYQCLEHLTEKYKLSTVLDNKDLAAARLVGKSVNHKISGGQEVSSAKSSPATAISSTKSVQTSTREQG